ncbi:hypothetical protein ANAEL_01829 [Anaerolineales bacterium]|nr:hypothetical protein ANAEL_01829 [Anaerolineales bacterium]
MTFNSDIHHRRSIRLKDYDYSRAGAYFVTICAFQRECLFGEIIEGKMHLNTLGLKVVECWQRLADHFPHLTLDESVIMPNHFHGIVHIGDTPDFGSPQADSGEAGESLASPLHLPLLQGTVAGSLGAIVQNFKSVSTRKINVLRQNRGCPLWQRNYYERVIRNETELARAREYIANNPMKWELDKENPANVLKAE